MGQRIERHRRLQAEPGDDVALDQGQPEHPLESQCALAAKQVGERYQRRGQEPHLADVVAQRLAWLARFQGDRQPDFPDRPSGSATPALANSQSRDSVASLRARATSA